MQALELVVLVVEEERPSPFLTCPMPMETSFHYYYYYYYHLQILKAIVVVYTIKTSMSNVWQLSGGCLYGCSASEAKSTLFNI
jgi:hypothetical protein